MSQTLPLGNFKRVEETYEFNKDFIKNFNGEKDNGYFLEVRGQYPENFFTRFLHLSFYPKEKYIKTSSKTFRQLE